MTCGYCRRDHILTSCPGCGAPGLAEAAHPAARFSAYSQLLKDGVMSIDDVRRSEGLEPLQSWLGARVPYIIERGHPRLEDRLDSISGRIEKEKWWFVFGTAVASALTALRWWVR